MNTRQQVCYFIVTFISGADNISDENYSLYTDYFANLRSQ